jgi:NTE family protein
MYRLASRAVSEMPEENGGAGCGSVRQTTETAGPRRKSLAGQRPIESLTSSIDIMQVRIARSRMAGEPPDLVVAPRLADLHLLDFHRAKETIEEGRRAMQRVAHILAELRC